MKKENILKNLICAGIAVVLILLGVFCFRESYIRFAESCRDLGLAVAGLFCKVFSLEYTFNAESVFEISDVKLEGILPLDFSALIEKSQNFIHKLFDLENIVGYFHSLWVGGYVLFYVLFVGVPLALIIWLLIALNLKGQNVDYGAETKPLILYKRFENKVIGPVTFAIKEFAEFVKESRLWKVVWCIIIAFSLNVVTIAIECFAFYYTMLGGFSSSAYIAVYKLFVDLSVLSRVPIAVWIIVALVVVSIWRKKTGYRRLRRREMLNRKIIETLSTFVIFFATMGAGKTLTMTDVILSQQQKIRDDAKDIMSEVDFAFPDFPWVEFEQDMKYRMNEHVVEKKNCFSVVVERRVIRPTLYNLQSIEACFDNLKKSGERYFTDEKYRMFYDKAVRRGKLKPILWGYDVAQYGTWYDNALKFESIYDALRDYAQAYFIYSMTTSMIISNYAVVTKDVIDDAGNFPLWMTDFFEVPTFDSECPSMNSHILDNDMLRLGKKFDENNKFKDSFEFGVLAYTEGDKERGNMLENLELKKTSEEVNQKNDNFNAMFKMSRHPATIRNRKFFFAYMDMQRTGSINADLKEIGDNVRIDSVDSIKMLMPFFDIEELMFNLIVPRFVNRYYKYRHDRGDMNLTMYLMKKIATAINNHYVKSYNTFGCKVEHLIINEERKEKYNIMPKKIFSGVFASDALASFFRMKSSKTSVGIKDIPTFKTDKASLEELLQLNSYFVRDWMQYLGKDE